MVTLNLEMILFILGFISLAQIFACIYLLVFTDLQGLTSILRALCLLQTLHIWNLSVRRTSSTKQDNGAESLATVWEVVSITLLLLLPPHTKII